MTDQDNYVIVFDPDDVVAVFDQGTEIVFIEDDIVATFEWSTESKDD